MRIFGAMVFVCYAALGTVACHLELREASEHELIYTKDYHGHYEKEAMAGLYGTWEEVMELALENMIDSIVKDPELAIALSEVSKE